MQKFNLQELVSQLQESHREFDIGDSVAVHFKGEQLPIKIDGMIIQELKIFKGSFCIYDVYNPAFKANDYRINIEVLSIEEYSDSPHSIYIDKNGNLDSYEYNILATIEIGNLLTFEIRNNRVHSYMLKGD